MLRVTVDTNLYISVLNSGGKPEQLLRLGKARIIQLVISDAIVTEIGTVLRGKKFAWPELEVLKAQHEIEDMSERVHAAETLYIITEDPSDNRILECAAAGEVDFIVSGDKHLLKLGQFRNSPFLKIAEFLKRL